MLVSVDWLKTLVPLGDDVAAVAHRLTMAGIEVEGVHRPGAGNRGLLVAEVRTAEPVPGKSLLKCVVYDGAERLVICGDTTIRAGESVAYAPPGSAVNGREMGARKFGDVESQGMLCSLSDLGLEEKSDGVLRVAAPAGTPLGAVVDLADTVWELNITPNRSDCLSHRGVARELAAVLEAKLVPIKPRLREKGAPGEVTVAIEDPRGCPHYTARVIRGVKVGPSPLWVRLRLERCGMRSINNVVDATNLVVLELGQPLHAFDAAKLAGNQIVVRRARAGESAMLLDGKERKLDPADLVIADAARPVALAGVMGGANSEVSATTADIVLESAYFDPVTVRKSSKRHGLHTEASHRFERAVDPAAVALALDRCAELIVKLAGGAVAPGRIEQGEGVLPPPSVTLRPARIARILGIDVPAADIKGILRRLGCEIAKAGGNFVVVPPSWRPDLSMEIDLIEEIARLYGYDKIPAVAPLSPLASAPGPLLERTLAARLWMQDQGFHEAVTYSFIAPEWAERLRLAGAEAHGIKVGNPLTVEQSVMRTLLLPSLLDAAQSNLRRGNAAVKIFDQSRVFHDGDPIEERLHLGAAAFGAWDDSVWAGKDRPADFYDLKGVLEGLLARLGLTATYSRGEQPFLHPGMAAKVGVAGKTVGWIGALHPEVARKLDLPGGFVFEIDLDALPVAATTAPVVPSKYPAVMRDVAFLIAAETPAGEVADTLRGAGPAVLESVVLFDAYAGAALGGKKNLAYHLRFQAPDRTLTDDEVDAAVTAMVKAVEQAYGAELRAR